MKAAQRLRSHLEEFNPAIASRPGRRLGPFIAN
jgi:hypothetical protein